MKKCSFCGQEIPRDSLTCRFCNHPQAAARSGRAPQKISYSHRGSFAVLAAVAAVTMMTMVQRCQPGNGTFENRTNRSLAVSGARDPRGMVITNRESEPLSECVITITQGGRSNEWRAVVPKLAPAESATLTWSEFRKTGGSEMPAGVGTNARYATVRCESHKDTRKGAAIAFR
jgi:hypothetical protein